MAEEVVSSVEAILRHDGLGQLRFSGFVFSGGTVFFFQRGGQYARRG
ncbi:MAG: hypothetical protein HYS38_01120 [Acidobacteria bacterium]|nr:hypothetical protein [Acidobacteriota bacterium]